MHYIFNRLFAVVVSISWQLWTSKGISSMVSKSVVASAAFNGHTKNRGTPLVVLKNSFGDNHASFSSFRAVTISHNSDNYNAGKYSFRSPFRARKAPALFMENVKTPNTRVVTSNAINTVSESILELATVTLDLVLNGESINTTVEKALKKCQRANRNGVLKSGLERKQLSDLVLGTYIMRLRHEYTLLNKGRECDDNEQDYVPSVGELVKEHARYIHLLPEPHAREIHWPVDPIDYISCKYSLPPSLSVRLVDQYGLDDAESMARSMNVPGPITIRRNQRRVYTDDELISRLENQDGVIRTSRLVKGSLEIAEKQPTRSIWSMSSWQDGWFEVQDMGSQMVVAAALEGLNELDRDLQQSSNLTIVDYCAGNGGKTLAMISSLSSDAFDKASIGIVAHDVDMNRLKQLRGSLPRAGHPFSNVNVSITTELQNVPQLRPTGASNYDGNGGVSGGADLILVDAPCSSSGVIRRHASLRYNLILQAELQLEILRNASQLVKKSGILVYATCSIFHEENEDVVAMFESQPEFDNVWAPFDFDEQEKEGFWKNMSSKSSVLPDASHLRVVLPRGKSDNDNSNRHDELNSDGFFMARWKRK